MVPIRHHFVRELGEYSASFVDYHASDQQKAEVRRVLDSHRRSEPQFLCTGGVQPVRTLPHPSPLHLRTRQADVAPVPTQPFRFMDLPAELRMHTYRFLVQSGCAFSVTPCFQNAYGAAAHRERNRDCTAITKIKPTYCDIFHDDISSLSCTSRQVRHECYSILYGENQYVFRVAPGSECYERFDSEDFDRCQLWTKVFRKPYSTLWPLTENTLPFVKQMLILVTFNDERMKRPYTTVLRRNLDVAKMLNHAHKLRSLEVSKSRLQFHSIGGPRYVDNTHNTTIKADDKGALTLSVPGQTSAWDTQGWGVRMKLTQFVLEPLKAVHGIPEVTVTGLVEQSFAAKLASVMMSPGHVNLPPSRTFNHTETVMRKRRGRSKRRKMEVPVRKFWEATIDWESVSVPGPA